MRLLLRIIALGGAAALVACSVDAVTFKLGSEDCAAAGAEDSNDLADCSDPACADAPSCQAACGNGEAETGEDCDDGNRASGDGCDSNCTVTACGNAVMTADEVCDDGNLTDGDNCDSNCTLTGCGNGVMTTGELCDDGNLVDGDGCESNCSLTPSVFTYIKASNTGMSDQFGFSV